jgi:hypothetical protein
MLFTAEDAEDAGTSFKNLGVLCVSVRSAASAVQAVAFQLATGNQQPATFVI